MNKLIILLICGTLFIWGIFLFKLSDKVAIQNNHSNDFFLQNSSSSTNKFNYQDLIIKLEPQKIIHKDSIKNPFALPQITKPKPSQKKEPKQEAVQNIPQITLEAILPGDKPVAILRYNGESAVASAGETIWGVYVTKITENQIDLNFNKQKFSLTLNNN